MQISKWKDLNPNQEWLMTFVGVIDILLLAAALFDLNRRSPQEIRGNKTIWTLAVFVDFIGPGAYFLFGRRRD